MGLLRVGGRLGKSKLSSMIWYLSGELDGLVERRAELTWSRNGQLATLISSTDTSATSSSSNSNEQVAYAIVILGASGRAGGLVVNRVIPVSYLPVSF